MVTSIRLFDREIGPGLPCWVIAEAGVNHNGSLELAYQLIDAAVAAGADAVKFQTFKTEKLVTLDAPKAAYQKTNTGMNESQFAMLKRLELSPEDHLALLAYCGQKEIHFMSTPFDEESADFLDQLGMGVIKVPSGEITNHPFLEYIARKGKPMIVSTGMATLGEVEAAVETLERVGNSRFVLLHCVSNYPARPEDVNLHAMHTMQAAFGKPVGFSDHTLGIEVPLAAVALGACVVEKHFTLDKSLPGPDHLASLDPVELKAMVDGIRNVQAALGTGVKRPAASEADTAKAARRSLVSAGFIPAGSVLTTDQVVIRRPGTGLPPALLPFITGRKARIDIQPGTLLRLDLFE